MICEKCRLRVKTELQFASLSSQFGLPPQFLRRRLESSETAHLFHNSFGIKLIFQTLESAIDGFSLSNDYFGHKNFPFTGGLWAEILAAVNASVNCRSGIKYRQFYCSLGIGCFSAT
jgi:hypothetical protein